MASDRCHSRVHLILSLSKDAQIELQPRSSVKPGHRQGDVLGEVAMRWDELKREACSVARTVSVIGDRWTLLILRDCFLRVRRFEEFEARLGITRHILADRLKKLVEAGVLARVPYQERPRRYEYRLTEKGLDLHPIIMAIVHWGDVHMAGRRGRPLLHEHRGCGHIFDPVQTCSACGKPVTARAVRVRRGPGAGPDALPSAASNEA